MSKPTICVGVPFYGPQEAEWWSSFSVMLVNLSRSCEFEALLTSGTMATDHNRNAIVDAFLNNYKAEWLLWVDADNTVPAGAITRLLGTGKTLISGLYYGKNEPHNPIAYVKAAGAYKAINEVMNWERGEILPVDACGFGCMLTHRSVFDDIRENFVVLQRDGGGIVPIHKSKVRGQMGGKHETDGHVYKGQLHTRMIEPTLKSKVFPYFGLEFGRTEDMWFFDLAEQVGHKPWVDTGIECGHIRPVAFTGKDYREIHGA